MDIRVNLYRSSIVERCLNGKTFRVLREDVKKLELQRLKEITDIHKRYKRPMTQGAHFTNGNEIESDVSRVLTNGLSNHISPHKNTLKLSALRRRRQKSFGLRRRNKNRVTLSLNSSSASGISSVSGRHMVRKNSNCSVTASLNHNSSSEYTHTSLLSKDEIQENLNEFIKKNNISSINENGFECGKFKQVAFIPPINMNKAACSSRLNGIGSDLSRSTEPCQLPENINPFPLIPIESLRINERCLTRDDNVSVPSVKEFEQLKKEIAELREKYHEKQKLCSNELANEVESDVEEDSATVELQNKLTKTVTVNDVVLTTTDGWVESIDKDNNTVLTHQTIKGCAGSIPFTLQLLIQQEKDDEGPLENTYVVDLDLVVHRSAQEELKPFIEKMRSCRDIMLCIKGLHNYATWNTLREKTFEYFIQNHPGLVIAVQDSEGQELLIQNHQATNVRATVIWTVTTEETGHLTPTITLKVQKTRQAALTDRENLISRLSHIFQLMLQVFGVERSISTIIEMLNM